MIKDIQLNYRRFTKKCGMDITQSDNTCGQLLDPLACHVHQKQQSTSMPSNAAFKSIILQKSGNRRQST